jgi:hypothetical protein
VYGDRNVTVWTRAGHCAPGDRVLLAPQATGTPTQKKLRVALAERNGQGATAYGMAGKDEERDEINRAQDHAGDRQCDGHEDAEELEPAQQSATRSTRAESVRTTKQRSSQYQIRRYGWRAYGSRAAMPSRQVQGPGGAPGKPWPQPTPQARVLRLRKRLRSRNSRSRYAHG